MYGHYTLSGPNQPDSLFRTGSDSRLTRRWVVSDLPTRRLGDLIGLLSSIHLYWPNRHIGHERAWRGNTRRDELLRDLDRRGGPGLSRLSGITHTSTQVHPLTHAAHPHTHTPGRPTVLPASFTHTHPHIHVHTPLLASCPNVPYLGSYFFLFYFLENDASLRYYGMNIFSKK